jgi:hypothetical protein
MEEAGGMLDATTGDLARRRIAVRIVERHDEVAREVALLREKFGHQGILQSSIAAHEVARVCAREADVRAQLAWREFANVLLTAGVRPPVDDALAADLKAEVARHLPLELAELVK